MVIDSSCPEWKEKGGKEYDSCYDCSSCYECAYNMDRYGSIHFPCDSCEYFSEELGTCTEWKCCYYVEEQ